jgi:hypothetical protein
MRIVVLVALCLGVPGAPAAEVYWINPSGGVFTEGANWAGGLPPGQTDNAVFDIAGTYVVTLTQDHAVSGLRFLAGDVTLNATGFTLSIGDPQRLFSALISVEPPQESVAVARLVGGTEPLMIGSNIIVGQGGNLQMEAANVFDSQGCYMFLTEGAVVHVNGGILNIYHADVTASTFEVTGGAIITVDSLETHSPSTLRVSGAGSQLRADAGMGAMGTLSVLDGGDVQGYGAYSMVRFVGCSTLVSGAGSSISRGTIQCDANSPMTVESGGAIVGGTFNGPVSFGPGGATAANAIYMDLRGPFNVDQGAMVTPYGLAIHQGLAVVLDGLGTRSDAIIAPRGTPSSIDGPLVVQIRNANALRVGRVIPVFLHSSLGAGDAGGFTSISAPELDGGRMFTMTQTGSTGTVAVNVVAGGNPCWSADFDGDGDTATDADIEAFFACFAGNCCATCGSADFNGDGDSATDADIESFFRVLAGGPC